MQESNKKRTWVLALCALGLLCALALGLRLAKRVQDQDPVAVQGTVILNEIMASNDGYPDGKGQLLDWVELHNTTSSDLDMGGWGLSDESSEIKHVFSSGTVVPAGGYLRVSCGRGTGREDVAAFGISAQGGETVCLYSPDGLAVDAVITVPMGPGQAMARGEDGSWELLDWATPGQENSLAGLEAWKASLGTDDTSVRISEIMASNLSVLPDQDGDFSDWVELTNTGRQAWDLTGYWLSDDPEKPMKWEIPALVLDPGERVVIFCSGKDRQGDQLHAGFRLAAGGGSVLLTAPAGASADRVDYETLGDDQALYLAEDGTTWETGYLATPGYPNTEQGREDFLAETDQALGALVISEAVGANNFLLQQLDGEYYDWVELQNVSDQTIVLSDYTITTNSAFPEMYRLPEVELKPGAYYVLICSGDETLSNKQYDHANFSISAQEERLYIYGPEGALSDRALVRGLPYGGSMGRLEGQAGFFLFDTPTPGKANGEGYRAMSQAPLASQEQGVYEGVDALTVSLEGEGPIYYTLDGSVPTADSEVYTRPFALDSTTVIRAVCAPEGKVPSDPATFSYIINEGHQLPVVSLVCDPDEMFGRQGVYKSLSRDQVCDGLVSFFGEEGTFTSGCSISLHGCTSRYVREKKTFKVEFNDRFGGNLEYDVFGQGEITEYSSLLLRAGTVRYMSILRDAVAAQVAEDVSDNILALDVRYCVLYVNGEYFGLYTLREDYSRQYVASHTQSTPDSVHVAKAPVLYSTPGQEDLVELLNFIQVSDMGNEDNYALAASQFDMEALCDWIVMEGYFNNHDVAGNIRYVRGDGTGGRWRICLFDFDLALQNASCNFDRVFEQVNQIGRVVSSLTASPQFRALLLERTSWLLHNGLDDVTVLAVVDEFAKQIDSEVARDAQRWEGSVAGWKSNLEALHRWFTPERSLRCVQALDRYLQLTDSEWETWFGDLL